MTCTNQPDPRKQAPPSSPTPYAFEKVLAASEGREPDRLEAQNHFIEKQAALDFLPELPATGRILDAGSGTGYWAARLARLVPRGQVVCLDRSAELLTRARTRLEGLGVHSAEYLHQDLRALDLPVDAFDLIFTSMTLVHVTELEQTLRGLTRSLKPGGWMTLFETVQDSQGMFESYPPCPELALLVEQMRVLCLDIGVDLRAGLRIVHTLDGLGLESTALRYFGSAPHGEDLRGYLEDVFLPIARTYLASRFRPEDLDRRIGLALAEALRPGTWLNLKQTVALGRKPA